MGSLNGCYVARYEGLGESGRQGIGVVFLRDGNVMGNDNLSCFVGHYQIDGEIVTAKVKVFPLVGPYFSVTGLDDKPWDLPDIRGKLPKSTEGAIEVQLDGERYDTHQAISIYLRRIVGF